jgi:hypothetical protein
MFIGTEQRRRLRFISGFWWFGEFAKKCLTRNGAEDSLTLVSMTFWRTGSERPVHDSAQASSLSGDLTANTDPHLRDGIEMKCVHFRWVPHPSSATLKAKRVSYSHEMTLVLVNNIRPGFNYILTEDGLWINYDQSQAAIGH